MRSVERNDINIIILISVINIALNIGYVHLLNCQPRIMHFAYSEWFTLSWLSDHIP